MESGKNGKKGRDYLVGRMELEIRDALVRVDKVQANYKRIYDRRMKSVNTDIRSLAGEFIYITPEEGMKNSKLSGHALCTF